MPILQITIYEIRHFTLITELLTFPQTFHFLHAYLMERYCITVPLVLILFGGTAFPLKKKIFGVTAFPASPSPRLHHWLYTLQSILCRRPSRLGGGIMFSACPSVHSSVCYQVVTGKGMK